ncbi:adenylate/guanylate cyclase domain-containing protein [bacterium]|nr:adenylate/guanylate cyclase domain-containing protein [bacterium]
MTATGDGQVPQEGSGAESTARVSTEATGPTGKRRRGPSGTGRRNLWVTLLLGLFPAVFLSLVPIPILEQAEWATYDVRLRLRDAIQPQPISEKLVLVGLNEKDSADMGDEIASREAYIRLLGNLHEWGAEMVVFDIFFERTKDHDDILSWRMNELPTVLAYRIDTNFAPGLPPGEPPEELAELLPLAEKGTDAAELEALFVHSLAEYEGQLAQYRQQAMQSAEPMSPEEEEALALRLTWTRAIRRLLAERWMELSIGRPFESQPGANPIEAASPIMVSPTLLTTPNGMGIANIEKSEGAVVRSIPLVFAFRNMLYPNLDLAALCEHYGTRFRDVEIDWGEAITIHPTRNAEEPVRIPIDDRGYYLVNYRQGEDFLQRPSNPSLLLGMGYFPEEAANRHIRERMKNAIVFVGELVAGGRETDVEPIPLQPAFPMVGVHVNVVDNVLRGDYVRRTPVWFDWLLLMVLGAGAGVLFFRSPFRVAVRVTVLGVVFYLAAAVLLFGTAGWVLPIARPVLAAMFWTVFLFAYIVGVAERDRRLVRDVFLRSVSPRIGEEILKNYDNEAIWGSNRELTVLFVDIRGYTTLSERHDPEVVLGILDGFYDTVSEIVFRHEGQVNKFIGDAVMALFGAIPEEPPNHAERALRAAIEIQKAMSAFGERDDLRAQGIELATGAGINTGEAVAGLVGRRKIRIEFTAIGDVVNLSSRLQGLATTNEIVAGSQTMEILGGPDAAIFGDLNCQVEQTEGVYVKGKSEEQVVYKIRVMSS